MMNISIACVRAHHFGWITASTFYIVCYMREVPCGLFVSACSVVYILAKELKPRTSPLRSRLPASQLRGLSGSGAESSASTAWHTAWSVQAGLHVVLRMSKHTSPVCARRG